MHEPVKLVSPIDGSVYAERRLTQPHEIDHAVQSAREAQRTWRRVPLADKQAILHRFVDALGAMNDEVVPELAWQMGRPVRYGGEYRGVEERARHMIDIAPAALAPLARPPKAGFTRTITREPLGLVLVIAPWNYPYMTAINSLVPALMAGNAVLLKHASQTLLVGERLASAAAQCGLPDGLFHNLVLSHTDTETLIGSGAIDHINFTGSVSGGRAIEKAAAGTFATLGLELGGKDPAYVRADAELATTVESLVDGALFNSGQSCCGIERIYVAEPVYDAFIEQFAASAATWTLGHPLDDDTIVGPMARGSFADHVRQQTNDAVQTGARRLLNQRHDLDKPGSPYLPPEVLVDVNHTMSVMREESFGPVVGIMKVQNDAEAVALMNDSPYGLTASIWTADIDTAATLASDIDTGTVFANRCDYLDPELVWTGVKETGKGGALSEIGYANLTQPKSRHFKHID